MIHQMNLYSEPFRMIRSGEKTIELRLNDEKRQKLRVGDEIVFIELSTGEQLTCTVTELYHFPDFAALYASLPLLQCGYTKDDVAAAKPEDMELYYPKEQQAKYGVLGIRIKL